MWHMYALLNFHERFVITSEESRIRHRLALAVCQKFRLYSPVVLENHTKRREKHLKQRRKKKKEQKGKEERVHRDNCKQKRTDIELKYCATKAGRYPILFTR